MDPTLVVLISFVAFLGIAYRLGYHQSIAALDHEIKTIRHSLEEASQAKEAAIQALAEEHRRNQEIQAEIKLVAKRAEEQAHALRDQALDDIHKTIKIRQETAKRMIERMQSTAIQTIRDEIAAATVAVVEELVTTRFSGSQHEIINDGAIDQIAAHLTPETTPHLVKPKGTAI